MGPSRPLSCGYTAAMSVRGHPKSILLRAGDFAHWRDLLIATWLVAAFLSGCATTSDRVPSRGATSTEISVIPQPVEGEQIRLEIVEEITRIAIETSFLDARYQRNHLAADGLDASTLMAVDSRLAWLSGDQAGAASLLERLRLQNSRSRQFVLQEMETQATLQGDWLGAASAVQALLIDTEGSVASASELRDRLFAHLLKVETGSLKQAMQSSSESSWRFWLSMQLAYREGVDAFENWLTEHQSAPPSDALPRHLTTWYRARPPEHVALLIPLSGNLQRASEAVLHGALEQLFQLYPDPNERPRLSTLDSTRYPSAGNAFDAAVRSGADMVIGPLTRDEVSDLYPQRRGTVPVIALNRPENPRANQATPNWLALSLAPEDEAAQAADAAFGQGCRHAVVLAASDERGARLLNAFEARWLALGGKIRGLALLEDDNQANQLVGDLLGSGVSDERIGRVERAFDLPVDSRGRRRADFECIAMLAPDPARARNWRPLLVFHLSGDVPVYATSAIYDGTLDTRNRDLNGVYFVETPLMLDGRFRDRLTRFEALGRDAMLMTRHWQQAADTEQPIVRGDSGILQRGPDGSITRTLKLAIFDGEIPLAVELP